MKELMHYGIKGMRWGIRNSETLARYKRDGNNSSHVLAYKKEKRKQAVNNAFTASVKQGKDKDKITPVEKTARETQKITQELGNINRTLSNATKRQPQSSEKAKSMTDAELRRAINRIRMEREYDSLTREDTRRGYDEVSDILSIVGSTAAVAASVASIAVMIKTIKG